MAYKFILMLVCLCIINAKAFKRIWKRDYSYYNRPCLTLKETQAIGPDAHPRLCSIPSEYLAPFINAYVPNSPVSTEPSYNQYNLPPNVPNYNYNNGYANNIPPLTPYINIYPPSPVPSYNNGYQPNVPAMENNGIYSPSPGSPSNLNVPAPISTVPILGNISIPDNVGIYGQPITPTMPPLVSDTTVGLATDNPTTPSLLDSTLSSTSVGVDITTTNSSIMDPIVSPSPSQDITTSTSLIMDPTVPPSPSDPLSSTSVASDGSSNTVSIGDSSAPTVLLPSNGVGELTPINGLPPTSNQQPSTNPLATINSPIIDNNLLSQTTLLQGDQSTPIGQSGINKTPSESVPSLVPSQDSGTSGESASTSLLSNGEQTNPLDKTTNLENISNDVSTGLNQRGVKLKVAANLNNTCPKGYQLHIDSKMCISIMTNTNLVQTNTNLIQNVSKIPQLQLTKNTPALHNPIKVKPSFQNPNPIANRLDNKLQNTESNLLQPNPFLTINHSLNSQTNQIQSTKSSTVGPLPMSKLDFLKLNNITKAQTIILPLQTSPNNPGKKSTNSSISPINNNSLISTSGNRLINTRGDLLLPIKSENLNLTGSKPAITSDGKCPAGQVLNSIMNICVKSNAAPVPNNQINILSDPSLFPGNTTQGAEQNKNLQTNILTNDVLPNFSTNPIQNKTIVNTFKKNPATNELFNDNTMKKENIPANDLLQNNKPIANALKNNPATNELFKDNTMMKGDISTNFLLQNNKLNPMTSFVNCNPGLSNFPQFNINCLPFARAKAFQRSFKIPGLFN